MYSKKKEKGRTFNCGNAFLMHTHIYEIIHTKPVTSLDWSWRKLICTTLKCISIKEKHIEVSGEERRERHLRERGRRIRVWNSVWEYESNRRRKGRGGGQAQLYLAGKEGMENGREREGGHFHLIFFSRNNALFWDESDSEKGVGRFEMQLKILTLQSH